MKILFAFIMVLLAQLVSAQNITNLINGQTVISGTQLTIVPSSSGPPPCLTVLDQNANAIVNVQQVGSGTSLYSAGLAQWNASVTATICSVSFLMTGNGGYGSSGNVSGYTYTASIYAYANPLTTALATSSAVSGATLSSAFGGAMVNFVFPTPYTVTSGNAYVIVVTQSSVNGSNYAAYWYSALAGGLTGGGYNNTYYSSGSQSGSGVNQQPIMIIYKQ